MQDFRYMATSDLLNELQKDSFKADAEIERKICQIVLQQLEDPSGDISGLAVKWCAPSAPPIGAVLMRSSRPVKGF